MKMITNYLATDQAGRKVMIVARGELAGMTDIAFAAGAVVETEIETGIESVTEVEIGIGRGRGVNAETRGLAIRPARASPAIPRTRGGGANAKSGEKRRKRLAQTNITSLWSFH
jgi:hypothetical protein